MSCPDLTEWDALVRLGGPEALMVSGAVLGLGGGGRCFLHMVLAHPLPPQQEEQEKARHGQEEHHADRDHDAVHVGTHEAKEGALYSWGGRGGHLHTP
ncbi:hypothetical protein FKM82_005281 [Ascaphus truei]